MVNESGQLYTIEGIAAAFLMIVTTYIVLSTTTIYTPADTHVIDMQLEQLGYDALAMMDTADSWDPTAPYESELGMYIHNLNTEDFNSTYYNLINTLYHGNPGEDDRPIHFTSKIYYRDTNNLIQNSPFFEPNLLLGTRQVTVTRWVYVKYDPGDPSPIFNDIDFNDIDDRDQLVLLEVTLWRD